MTPANLAVLKIGRAMAAPHGSLRYTPTVGIHLAYARGSALAEELQSWLNTLAEHGIPERIL